MIVGGNYTIDFAKVSNIPKFEVGVKAGDSKRKISLTLLENNTAINLNNYTVVVACKKSDGNDIFNDVNIVDAINGKCEVEITEQMLALDTDLPCEIVLYGGNGVVATSSNFVIGRIASVRNDKSIVSSSEFSALTEAMINITGVKNDITKKMNIGDKIKVSQIDKNAGKLDQTYMSDEFLQQIAGNTPVNSVPSDLSITTSKIANNSITPNKIHKREGVLLHGNSIEVNFKELQVKVLTKELFITGKDGYIDLRGIASNGLPVISIPENAINVTYYTQYSLWVSLSTASIDFTESSRVPSNGIILANFYQGKPYVNNLGNGLIVIDKYGKRVDTSLSQLKNTISADLQEIKGSIPPSERVVTINTGKIDIITSEQKMVIQVSLLSTPNTYYSLDGSKIELSYADIPNPDYAKFLYFNTSSREFLILNNPSKVPNNYALVLTYYDGKLLYSSADTRNLFINGKRYSPIIIDNSSIGNGTVPSSKLIRPLRALVHANSIEVNFQELKVKVLTGDTYFITETGYIDMRGHGGAKLSDIDIPQSALTDYTLWSLWFNPTDRTLNFTTSSQALDSGVELGRFYRGNAYVNPNGGIKVINSYGNDVITSFKQISSQASSVSNTYFYSENVAFNIVFNNEDYTITATSKKGTWLIFDNGGVDIAEDKEFIYQADSVSINYAFKLFVNKNNGTPKIIPHTSSLSSDDMKNHAFVCVFSNYALYTPTFSPKVISINGKTPKTVASAGGNINESSYNWDNNRFVIPNDLYLVKDIPYSIFAPNFNMEQLVDNDDCLYEIGLPTKVVQFEQSADIQIPFSFEKPYRTRVAGKNKNKSSMLTKDLYLHVADTNNVIKKDVKILCIGDSITNSNYPKHLKWQLKQFGINATMIGTVTCSHESYSYGISKHLTSEKGEGRGGWRLTDFTCTTPLKDGGYYINSSFPMMNPSTNKFDFSYYMNKNNFTDVDFVVINLGTNDMSGYHYAGSTSTNSAYNTIRRVDIDTEYLNSESEYYLAKQYKILIDSIHEFNPNIKIAINPPMTSGTSSFIVNSMKWAEIVQYEFEGMDNVYMLGSYLGQGQLSVSTIEGSRQWMTQVNDKNETLKSSSVTADVHVNGIGQLIHTLYPASWIVNMCL